MAADLVRSRAALPAAALVAFASGEAQPHITVRAFVGDVADQHLIGLAGEIEPTREAEGRTSWRCSLSKDDGQCTAVVVEAVSHPEGEATRWRYRITNDGPDLTICEVTFPTIEGVRFGDSWKGNRVLWPSLAQGAVIDDLTTAEAFAAQCKPACKENPYLYGQYVGDLCLPYFVHSGPNGSLSVLVLDPTHEVFAFSGVRADTGMTYSVTTYPRIPSGKSWRFGDILIIRSADPDWRPTADRCREWLCRNMGFPPRRRRGDSVSLSYSRWDRALDADEVIRWAKAFDVHDVCLWLHLYGRGDQYYPAYFPTLEQGVDGMTAYLSELRAAGLEPYFYTNGYLLSPLQTPADVKAWTEEYPEQYPAWLGDEGYAETVAEFRAQGYEFAGDWLQEPGGILPLRVRRVDFHWGEYPLYFWHQRPFWAACVAHPDWRKLFRDTARLHAQMGCGGIFMDQVAAMHPELCSAIGHGHDRESFGFWNRAYLELLREVRRTGDGLRPGFFIEVEGGSALFSKYVDRYLSWGWANEDRSFPEMLRYTAPWTRTYVQELPLDDADATARIIEHTLELGGVFRVSVGESEGPSDPRLTNASARLIRAAVAVRRKLGEFYDRGRYMDTVGLTAKGCTATWFAGEGGGALLAVQATRDGTEVGLATDLRLGVSKASRLEWRTAESAPVAAELEGGELRVRGLPEGLSLVVVPGHRE